MKIVLDTNVLVSALINPDGAPASIVNLILTEDLVILYDNRIINEYRNVLSRDKFQFDHNLYEHLLDFFHETGSFVIAKPVRRHFVDAADLKFYEVAISGAAEYLLTGNKKHFPKEPFIVAPHEFLEKLDLA